MTNDIATLYRPWMASTRPSMPPGPEKNATANNVVRVLMLAVVACVMMWNAMGRVDADMWIPFVCIIAVMGIGTRGAPVETAGFVAAEVLVVIFFGVATLSGSRDFIWAGSLGVSMLAIAKMGYLEISRRDVDGEVSVPKASRVPAPVVSMPPPATEPVTASEPVTAAVTETAPEPASTIAPEPATATEPVTATEPATESESAATESESVSADAKA